MNLGTLRTRVFAQADWQPSQSTSAKTRVNEFINRAIEQIALEAPQLFFTEDLSFRCQPDVSPASDADTVSVVEFDNWVLQRDITTGLLSASDWTTDGSWDARWIAVTLDTGEVIHRQIREVWSEVETAPSLWRQHISLTEPWPDGASTEGMDWIIYTPRYPLAGDIIRLRHARLRRFAASNFDVPMRVIGEVQAEDCMFEAAPGMNIEATPACLYRRGYFQLEGPKDAPTCVLNDNIGEWLGPEVPGQFEFLFTYVWGLRNEALAGPSAYTASAYGRKAPLYESAPSAVSSAITATGLDGTIIITTTNVDFELGFGLATDLAANPLLRFEHSGIRKRIYVRRKSANFTNYSGLPNAVSGLTRIDVIDDYFLLAEQDGSEQTYAWDGTVPPDRLCRLKDFSGNQMVAVWPRPSDEDMIHLNVVRRPQALSDDQDSPRLVPEAGDLVVALAGAMLAESEGRADLASQKRGWYHKHLGIVADQYGDLRPQNRPTYRRTASARKGTRPYRQWPSSLDFDR
jgi:hypothetical protein